MRVGGRVTLLLVAFFAASCGDTTNAAWRISFNTDAGILGADVVRVRLRVRSGGCEGTGLVYEADVSRTDSIPSFGEIGEGTFGFEAIARDAMCVVVARGCTPISLPLEVGDEIVTQLDPVSGEAPLCAPSACTNGICAPATDAGAMEAGIDAGTVDAM